MDPSGNIDTSLRGLYDYGDILAAIELMVKTGYSTVKQATPAGIATSIIFKPSKAGETEKDLKNDAEFQKFLSGGGTGDPNKGNKKKDKGARKTTREALLESASNQKLKNAIDQIYRPGATTGDGGLADAIRYQLSTGELVGGKDHLIKGVERVRNLENIIKKEALSSSDLNLAQKLLNNLKNALGGK